MATAVSETAEEDNSSYCNITDIEGQWQLYFHWRRRQTPAVMPMTSEANGSYSDSDNAEQMTHAMPLTMQADDNWRANNSGGKWQLQRQWTQKHVTAATSLTAQATDICNVSESTGKNAGCQLRRMQMTGQCQRRQRRIMTAMSVIGEEWKHASATDFHENVYSNKTD